MRRFLLVAALVAGAAVAATSTHYVRGRNTRLRQGPRADAAVIAVLRTGQPVEWQGLHPDDARWVRVRVGEQEGVVLRAGLADQAPQAELTSRDGGVPVDVEAFVSSGAGVRAFGPAALRYAKEKVYLSTMDQLLVAEAVARDVDDAALAAHAQDAGLALVVEAAP